MFDAVHQSLDAGIDPEQVMDERAGDLPLAPVGLGAAAGLAGGHMLASRLGSASPWVTPAMMAAGGLAGGGLGLAKSVHGSDERREQARAAIQAIQREKQKLETASESVPRLL